MALFLVACRLSMADPVGTQASPTVSPSNPSNQPSYLGFPAPDSNPIMAHRTGSSLRIERLNGNYSASVDASQPLRIMQLTDIHFDNNTANNTKTKQLISTMISRFKPDLVVVTGDLVWTLLNASGLLAYLQAGSKFMNDVCLSNDTYWAFMLGNHDTYYTASDQDKDKVSAALLTYRIDQPNGRLLYECESQPQEDRWGRYALEFVDRATGRPLWECYALYTGDGLASSIGTGERLWLAGAVDASRHRNRDQEVPSFAFFHIPLSQYGAPTNNSDWHGWKGEGISGQVESVKVLNSLATASVVACFAGHDHLNSFRNQWSLGTRNIYLYYGRFSGYGAPDSSGKPLGQTSPDFSPGCNLIDLNLRSRVWTCWQWNEKMSDPISLDAAKKEGK